MAGYAIEMLNITKAFPGVVANDDVTLRVLDNEVHAILGENGAGKSTLMSILFGLYDADSGRILVRGREVRIRDPNEATEQGIGMVHQHFKLVHNYTVTENIILGKEPRTRSGEVDLASAEKKVAELSSRYGLDVDPKAKIEAISVGMQQRHRGIANGQWNRPGWKHDLGFRRCAHVVHHHAFQANGWGLARARQAGDQRQLAAAEQDQEAGTGDECLEHG